MNTLSALPDQRFYRDADRAMLGGVCAGLAAYFGLRLKVTRLVACIAFLMVMPAAVIAYLAVVFLVPSVSRKDSTVPRPAATAEEIQRRCREIDERLVRLERHVTSSRFQLEQELSRL